METIRKKLKSPLMRQSPDLINSMTWLGTICLLFAPYLMGSQVGFALGAIGVLLITPPIWKNKQWNLVILNFSCFVGYSLQFLNII